MNDNGSLCNSNLSPSDNPNVSDVSVPPLPSHYLQTSQFPSCHSTPDYKTVWELTAYEENEAVQEFYVPVLSNFILTPEALSKNTKAKNLDSEARKKTRQPQLTQIMPTIDVDSILDTGVKIRYW